VASNPPGGGNFLTQKMGPLPVWAWGGILGAVAVVYIRMRGGSSSTGTTTGTSTTVPPAQGATSAPGGSPTLGGTPVYVYSQPGSNAQTADGSSGLLGPAPTTPLAVGPGATVNAETTVGGTAPASTAAGGSVTLGGAPGQPNEGIWSSNVATGTSPGGPGPTIPFGTYQLAGSPVSQNGQTYYPITGPGGETLFALGENVQNFSEGGGGAGPNHARGMQRLRGLGRGGVGKGGTPPSAKAAPGARRMSASRGALSTVRGD
jgi:hypothetical protein